MTSYKIQTAIDQDDLALKANQIIASHIDLALDERERAQIAFSGGSTPEKTYELLGKEHLPWDRVDLFLGDERWVDENDKASNAAMIRRTLLSSGPGSSCCFHVVPTVQFSSSSKSAEALSEQLKIVCSGNPPVFDVILLGLGDDGHTAYLFPESDALNIKDNWTAVTRAKGHERITLTAPVLSAARKVIFLVSGPSKQLALKRLIDRSEPFQRTPARLVKPNSEILILADESACSLL